MYVALRTARTNPWLRKVCHHGSLCTVLQFSETTFRRYLPQFDAMRALRAMRVKSL